MGLRLPVQTAYGITADYIHIGAVVNEYTTKMCQVTLLVYANYEARIAGASSLGSHNIAFANAEYPGDVDRATLYGIIKARAIFAGAVDC